MGCVVLLRAGVAAGSTLLALARPACGRPPPAARAPLPPTSSLVGMARLKSATARAAGEATPPLDGNTL
eukprot:15471001-Alexandrium_andersonii.AAC.1